MCNFLILLMFTNKIKLLDIFMNRIYFDSCTTLQIYIINIVNCMYICTLVDLKKIKTSRIQSHPILTKDIVGLQYDDL